MNYTLDDNVWTDVRAAIWGSIHCWVVTRLNGASASMGCSGGEPIDTELIHYLDKRYGHILAAHREESPGCPHNDQCNHATEITTKMLLGLK